MLALGAKAPLTFVGYLGGRPNDWHSPMFGHNFETWSGIGQGGTESWRKISSPEFVGSIRILVHGGFKHGGIGKKYLGRKAPDDMKGSVRY
mmetsp:Transcript_315/g.428  ORF Transcript_315/g.428 Transcript_315/m.428 type:complete len:91 (-) Transcript_315:235-507(-)